MTRAMTLLDVCVSFVACGIFGYVVDIYDLPLHGGRTELLSAILMLSVLLAASTHARTGIHVGSWRREHLAIVSVTGLVAVTEYLRLSGPSYILIYQLLVFVAVAMYVERRIAVGQMRDFALAFLRVANAYFVVLVAAAVLEEKLGGWFTAGELQTRNAPPYLALFCLCLLPFCNRPWIWLLTLLNAVALPIVMSTRGAIGLLAILACYWAAERLLRSFPRIRWTMFLTAFAVALVWPLLAYVLLQNYINIDDVRAMEESRHAIDPTVSELSSTIIRIMANVALFEAAVEHNIFLGLGMAAVNQTKLWGYYSHSLIPVVVGGWGILGLVLAWILIGNAYRLHRLSRVLALLVVFVYSVSNDLYAWIALAFAMRYVAVGTPSGTPAAAGISDGLTALPRRAG
jgi:hypothetical protein